MNQPEPHSTYEVVHAELLGSGPVYTITQVAKQIGITIGDVRSYWRSMGFPDVPLTEVHFTDADVEAIREMARAVLDDKVTFPTSQNLVRAQGHSMDRLVLWQVEALVEEISERFHLDDVSARLVVLDRFLDMKPLLESQLIYTWRRQLAALLGRIDQQFSKTTGLSTSEEQLPLERAVGFMDMVGYTSRTVQLTRDELAEIVKEFESTARDVVAANGARVVKTVGDAVLYVADDLKAGARVATDLVDMLAEVDLPVRSSVVWGRVLSRSGDIFGPIVNLASRLNDLAAAGTVLMDDVSAAILEQDNTEFDLEPLEATSVAGMGAVNPVRLKRRAAARTGHDSAGAGEGTGSGYGTNENDS